MDEMIKSNQGDVGNLIYEIRGQQVMLDSDLARLYGCDGPRVINQAVSRHPERFPDDFCFQLTKEEYGNLKSQVVISSSWNDYGGVRTLPHVFTEQGVSMLSSILRTKTAAEVSIKIMRAFVAMKKYISSNLLEQKYINELALKDHDRINLLEKSFRKFEEKRKDHAIFFNGQIYDAYSKIYEIFQQAKTSLIIIDNYADNITLNIIKNLSTKVTIITSNKSPLSRQDIEKYNKQYSNLTVIRNNAFHDRYFIIDGKIVYHCGTSVNYAGSKTFSITKLSDESVINLLKTKVAEIIAT